MHTSRTVTVLDLMVLADLSGTYFHNGIALTTTDTSHIRLEGDLQDVKWHN